MMAIVQNVSKWKNVKYLYMNKLQGKNIQIFEIIGKKPSLYNTTEFSQYLQTTDNKLFLANEPPFSRYKTGDLLAIDLDRTRFFSPNAERGKMWSNSGIVAKLTPKDPSIPSYKNIPIYHSEEFAGEWVEE
jgi:hypothetical protein